MSKSVKAGIIGGQSEEQSQTQQEQTFDNKDEDETSMVTNDIVVRRSFLQITQIAFNYP